MAIEIISATHNGLDGILIKVEVDINKGMPSFNIVGLPDASVKESKERVRSAIINSGFEFPLGRITINLAPADIRKIGSLLDLPIALGILIKSNQVIEKDLKDFIVFGELSLKGELKAIKGVLPIIFEGKNNKKNSFIFPFSNLKELRSFNIGNFYPFKNLKEVISFINYEDLLPFVFDGDKPKSKNILLDYSEIIGQQTSKRAMEIAAAGRHNILLYGAPGAGKTMLAKALPSIMPPLSPREEIEIAKIYSASGMLEEQIEIPFRSPHHTITKVALVGGGKEIKAGEVTLAHNGVLFLDEILEFKRDVLEVLREPLEEKVININRINGSYKLPSNFLLIGAFNPCPCGLYIEGFNNNSNGCTCSERDRKRYTSRLSRAMLDRIDLLNYVPRLKVEEINKRKDSLSSNEMKRRVLEAREIQKERYSKSKYNYNSEVKGKDINKFFNLSEGGKNLIDIYYEKCNLTMRGYDKIIKVARTIADLDLSDEIYEYHIFEALGYRKNMDGEII